MNYFRASRAQRLIGRRLSIALLALATCAFVPFPAIAADAIMKRGDAAVTGFSGARVWGNVPPDVSPTDVTLIDTGGAVLRVFDLTRPGGPATGALANAPSIFQATAGDVGQVFGVALDSDTANRSPNIYLTSTSLFGLQIVSKEGRRLVNGERGARWMPGQFGVPKGGGPGSVWKIDGVSGAISLFANLGHDGKDNAGPGLGNVAYDAASNQLFVTDLEFGLIHRLGLDGSHRGSFDHGTSGRANAGLEAIPYDAARRTNIERPEFNVEDPFTWGFADARRRVFAVTVQSGRLYYSVAKPLQIWSVGLNSDGSFADDARAEFDVKDTPNDNIVTDILFDGPDRLYLSQRGGLTGSYDYAIFAKLEKPVVRRYAWNDSDKRWSEEVGEFAIGLKLPHRSTLGGIALSYGYDADGKIDYGKCRETLWTSGEHLRESENKERDYKGGARVVHGLQGTDKANIRPANEPPYQTWFVDNDGQYDDADLYSRIGDIAIYAPCDALVAAAPSPPLSPTPIPTPPGGPGVWVHKVCTPAPFGGPIHCVITVTNSGSTPPEDPVTIWDAATILAGPGAGGAVMINAVAPDIPQWFCSPTPTANLSCTLAPELLPPGASHSIDVTIDTGPLLLAGNHGFRNCAVLSAPWFGEACADGGTQLTIVKTAPAACAPGADCTFGVTITNNGSLPFSGDVVLSDSMFMGPAAALPAPITIAPPLGCVPAPAAVPFSCTAPLTLAAGASQAFSITATLPIGPAPGYWARNCIAVSAPGVAPPALPPAAPGDSNVSCAWVPVGAPLPLNNLRLTKTALHAGKCSKAPGDIILCDYEISLTNDGPSPYHGMLTVNETVPAASTLTVGDPTWACAGGPPVYGCNTLAAVDIAVGASLAIPLQVSIPLAPLEGAGCSLPNTAAIVAPAGGGADNFNAGDDADTAIADAFLTWVDIFGVTQVTCDPTNLKTKKVSKGDCVAVGENFRCAYTVTVTNTGPDPYHGPLKVSEQLGFAPTSVLFSADWGCSGGGASYQCTNPHVDMEKGQSVELDLTVNVPGGRQCELINRAATIFPVAGTRYNNVVGDDLAAATAKIPDKSCEKPDRPQCEPGTNELRSESGACVCKTGYMRDHDRGCVGIVEPPRCPDGKPVPKNGRCPGIKPQCEPGPNEVRTDEGRCVCKGGYERDDRGRCIEEPTPLCEPGRNEYRNDKDQCVCKRGYERDKNGRCVDEATPLCELGKNEYRNDDGRCVCKTGYERDNRGRCVEETKPLCEPGPNEVRNDKGACVCKRGYERDKNGRCVTDVKPQCEPGPNEVRDDNGKCVCKSGYERDKNGRCVEETKPLCEPGPNEVRDDNGKCVCKRGYERDKNGRCVKPTDPADECRKQGKAWDGKRCVEPTSPADECRKQGKVWDGKRCVDQPKPKCPTGTTGTPPNCKSVEKPKCPTGTTGTPPNCKRIEKPKCPTGTVGTPPNCKSIEKPKCPSGMIGTPPNCKPIVKRKCPTGTIGTPPNCKSIVKLIVKPKCPTGTTGMFPNCKKVSGRLTNR
jgi:hypothetical protein